MPPYNHERKLGYVLLGLALLFTIVIYWPGLSGGWLFDDYPNIVDNHGVQPQHVDFRALVTAALSSPASEFKRPLASLTFAANYVFSGLHPWGWKITNLIVHLINGVLVFVLARLLLRRVDTFNRVDTSQWAIITASFIAGAWMILPINLTAVLYIVQREESLANLFVLLGLIGYIAGRNSMENTAAPGDRPAHGFLLCCLSLTIPVIVGLTAKETAVMIPLYALCVEWVLFSPATQPRHISRHQWLTRRLDWRIGALFFLVLLLPALIGLAWLLPSLLDPATWITRDFTLGTRLLTEARVVMSYLTWTVFPTPQALSFYHDQYRVSAGLLRPWTTLASILALVVLIALAVRVRKRWPLVALGILWFLAGQLLTGTILSLELVYEHRNYFASLGVMLAVIPWLNLPASAKAPARDDRANSTLDAPFAMARRVLLCGLFLCWSALTLITAYAWGNPLRQVIDFASRAPDSPRAMYELGRTYVMYTNYDPASPYRQPAYNALEKAAALPDSSILPQQALLFMNSRMRLPLEDSWWDSMISRLKERKSTVQDESALEQLSSCQTTGECDLPKQRMLEAYLAALSHPHPSARLLNMYGMYSWEVLGDHKLGVRMIQEAVATNRREPAYQVTLVRMLTDMDRLTEAKQALLQLQTLNLAGYMDDGVATLNARILEKEKADAPLKEAR